MSIRALRVTAALSGIVGATALGVYFAAPALTNWPYVGASAASLTSYANSHQLLFFAGAWLQVTGTLLSLIFFLAVVQLAGAASRLAGLVVIVASAALLGLVLLEAALLMEVPLAAASNDSATVMTTFGLSNGVFARVFPMAPASATYLGLGVVILSSAVLDRWFGTSQLVWGCYSRLPESLHSSPSSDSSWRSSSRWPRSCGSLLPPSLSGGRPLLCQSLLDNRGGHLRGPRSPSRHWAGHRHGTACVTGCPW